MSNNIVPIGQARMPANMRARIDAGQTTNSNFSGGIRDSFPMLSIKGKVFRIRRDGQEMPLIDPQTRQVIPFLDVILVNAASTLSKAYYKTGFEEGDFKQPDCWSLDSVKPDPSVPEKVNPTCPNCPMNVFGSAQSQDPSGTKRGGKACGDAKRIAVLMPGHLGKAEPMIFLLRVPATSLKNLKAYSDLLARQGWEPAACVTRLQFDYQQAYPKLEFHFVDSLNDGEYDEVVKHAEGSYVASMLAAPDFDMTASHPAPNPATQPRMRQEAPVLDETQTVTETKAEAKSQELKAEVNAAARPSIHALDDELIELPEGELFNPKTGEIVKKPAPKVEMPALDPDTFEVKPGKFFNRKSNQYVTGLEVGAPPMAEEPARKTRPKRAATAALQEATTAAAAAPQQETKPEQEDKPATNGKAAVQPASADLEAMLKDLIPTRKS
jgi:hypothetical protein